MSKITVNLSGVRWTDLEVDNQLHHSLFAMQDLVRDARAAIGTGDFYPRMREVTKLRDAWCQDSIEILSDVVYRSLRTAHHEAVKQKTAKLVGIMASCVDNGHDDIAFNRYTEHPLLPDLVILFYNDPDLRDMLEEIKVRVNGRKTKSVA
jgi:hypothetical protein